MVVNKIINVIAPVDCIVTNKEAKEEDKYRDLSIELVSLWKMKCEVILIVAGCLAYA